MSINQSLVEKVRNREAAILFDINKDSVEVLNELAKAISITSNGKLKGNHYYYGVHPEDNSLVFGFDNISDPTKYGAIPLCSFFEANLTPEDKERLNRISELLAELKPLMYGVSHLIDQDCYNPYAPITPVCEQPDNEVEEKEQIVANKTIGYLFTKGKIYPMLQELESHYRTVNDRGETQTLHKDHVYPKAQTTPVNGEWEKQDWAKCNDVLAIVQEVHIEKNNLLCTKVDGWATNFPINRATKPTDKEVETWLTSIAEKKYKKGGVIKYETHTSDIGNVIGFELVDGELYLTHSNAPNTETKSRVWRSGKWAETSETTPKEVEQKERWRPTIGEDYFSITAEGNMITDCWDDRWWDKSRFEFGNVFKSEEAATKAAIKIKELLSTL